MKGKSRNRNARMDLVRRDAANARRRARKHDRGRQGTIQYQEVDNCQRIKTLNEGESHLMSRKMQGGLYGALWIEHSPKGKNWSIPGGLLSS